MHLVSISEVNKKVSSNYNYIDIEKEERGRYSNVPLSIIYRLYLAIVVVFLTLWLSY